MFAGSGQRETGQGSQGCDSAPLNEPKFAAGSSLSPVSLLIEGSLEL